MILVLAAAVSVVLDVCVDSRKDSRPNSTGRTQYGIDLPVLCIYALVHLAIDYGSVLCLDNRHSTHRDVISTAIPSLNNVPPVLTGSHQ